MAQFTLCWWFGRFVFNHSLILVHFGSDNFKVALYSFFGARGIATNGASARVFKKKYCLITILMTPPKRGFMSDLKTHIARFQDSEFFRQLAHG